MLILVAWQLIAVFWGGEKHVVASPTEIISGYRADGWGFYWPNIWATVREAAQGWFWGNLLAIVLAVVFVQVPTIERRLLSLAIVSYCLPIMAIGPVLAILYRGETSKVILAALSVFFATLISMVVGLRCGRRDILDLVRAYGGGSWKQLRKVRLHSSPAQPVRRPAHRRTGGAAGRHHRRVPRRRPGPRRDDDQLAAGPERASHLGHRGGGHRAGRPGLRPDRTGRAALAPWAVKERQQ